MKKKALRLNQFLSFALLLLVLCVPSLAEGWQDSQGRTYNDINSATIPNIRKDDLLDHIKSFTEEMEKFQLSIGRILREKIGIDKFFCINVGTHPLCDAHGAIDKPERADVKFRRTSSHHHHQDNANAIGLTQWQGLNQA